MVSMELYIEGVRKWLELKRRGYTMTSMALWSLYSSTQFSIATPGFADVCLWWHLSILKHFASYHF